MPWVESFKRAEKKGDFGIAFEDAWKVLSERDWKKVAMRSATHLDEKNGIFQVSFMGKKYLVRPKERSVIGQEGEKVSPFYAFLIVHYLIGAKDIPLSNELISFRELYGGDVYYLAFKKRAIERIRKSFASRPEDLVRKGIEMGGEKARLGDYSVKIYVFPKLPVTIVLWMGDEEVPTAANILFDKTAGEHLPTEDIAAIAEDLARVLSS